MVQCRRNVVLPYMKNLGRKKNGAYLCIMMCGVCVISTKIRMDPKKIRRRHLKKVVSSFLLRRSTYCTGANKFTASIIAKGLIFGVFIKTGNSPTYGPQPRHAIHDSYTFIIRLA